MSKAIFQGSGIGSRGSGLVLCAAFFILSLSAHLHAFKSLGKSLMGARIVFEDTLIEHDPVSESLSQTKLIINIGLDAVSEPKGDLYYRAQGNASAPFVATPFVFTPASETGQSAPTSAPAPADGKKFYKGRAQIPKETMRAPGIQYFIRLFDGHGNRFFKSATAPQSVAVKDEICTSESVGGTKKSALAKLSNLQGGAALNASIELCMKKPDALPLSMTPQGGGIDNPQPIAYLKLSPDHTEFKKPARLTLSYNDFDGDGIVDDTDIAASKLKLFWWDNQEWRLIGGKVNLEDHTFSVTLSHFSDYGLFSHSGSVALRPRETIISPASKDGFNDFVNFDGLGGESFTIRIFDVTGRLVRTLIDLSAWDGKNDFDQIVESGMYIYQVQIQNNSFSGVVAVAK